ncbi:rho GTPase-activating protein 44-like isoform X2 [Ptychodera flava]|uniref:rho GTPase-activating protein 44-like isoform X2 n=1 Tax=Ptychodera flava TaxID=63121 RepID=UPI00396A918A
MLKKENMKKQFLRVKQLANQNFGRAEKSEVLSDELLQCEKKVENLKHASHNTAKKLGACLLGTGYEYEKRVKKLPESTLAATMMESSIQLGNNSIFGAMVATCGECQQNVGKELALYEMEIEHSVLQSLNTLAETDIPNVTAHKKKLTKAVLDMDSVRSRYHSAVRATTSGKGNLQEQVMKIEQLKDEVEESSNKMEAARDAYVTEMLVLLAREGEFAEKFVELVEQQADYHKRAAGVLDRMLPAMRELLEENPQRPVFGTSLESHLRVSEREIALPVEVCCEAIIQFGLEEEGLFRIAGSSSKVKKLKASFDLGVMDDADFGDPAHVHAVTGVLKQYLRELPEPLMTFALYDEWVSANSIQDTDTRLQALWTCVGKLPKPNFDNLKYLMKFLRKLLDHSNITKMTASNLALVIAPNVMWAKEDAISVMSTGTASVIVESMIYHADWFFPGEIDFCQNSAQSGTHTGLANRPTHNDVHPEHSSTQQVQQTPPQPMARTPSHENVRTEQKTPEKPDRVDSLNLETSPVNESAHQSPVLSSHARNAPPRVPTNKPTPPKPAPRPRTSIKPQPPPRPNNNQ